MPDQLEELWPAARPPSGFAERVVERALTETRPATRIRPARRQASRALAWAVPLLALVAAAALIVAGWSVHRRDRGELFAEVPQQISIAGRAQALLSAGAHVKWSTSNGTPSSGTLVEQDGGAVEYRVQPGGPFVVQTPFGRVQVTGTTFDVRVGATQPGDQNMKLKKSSIAASGVLGALLFVSVYEGKVQLSHGDRQIVLARGESGTIGADGVPERVPSQASASGPVNVGAEAARPAPATFRGPSPEQQQLRARVLATLREHQARKAAAAATAAPRAAANDSRDGTMVDKTGHLGPEVKIFNHELMPMVAQCFDEARQRKPHLHGMLAVSIKLAGAEGVGSIIESLEPDAKNELSDPELIDCIRQSAFSIQLPPPRADRSDQGLLTMPFGTDAGTP